MSGYDTPAGPGLQPLLDRIADLQRQLTDLQRPGATPLGSLVQQVQAALANLHQQVATEIAAQSMTRDAILTAIANPGNVAASGSITATGNMAANSGTFPGGVSSLDVRNRLLSTGYAVQYVDGSGQMGIVPSGLKYKQDVEPAETVALVEALRTVALVRFRYIAAVEELGEDAPYLLGSIAEYFVAAGLDEWVTVGSDGEPDGIAWERLTVPLIAGFQSLDARLSAAGL